MEYTVLGRPDAGPTLRLDHREFSYAGKFVMSNTGKAVARADGSIVAAVAFNRDRTDETTVWLRYITVRGDRRGEGIGARLAAFLVDRSPVAADRFRIAVNNSFAYEAMYKAGFGYTGERTGIAEVILEHPAERSADRYRTGLAVFADREELTPAERQFIDRKRERGPPERVDPPDG
ncbi:MAG: GNAT family N-acetyltransferase [Halobacteriales archaeon]